MKARKIISVLLSAVMILSTFGFTAFAEEQTETISGQTITEVINLSGKADIVYENCDIDIAEATWGAIYVANGTGVKATFKNCNIDLTNCTSKPFINNDSGNRYTLILEDTTLTITGTTATGINNADIILKGKSSVEISGIGIGLNSCGLKMEKGTSINVHDVVNHGITNVLLEADGANITVENCGMYGLYLEDGSSFANTNVVVNNCATTKYVPVAPKGAVTVDANSTVKVDGNDFTMGVANISNTYYKTLADAIAAAESGDVINLYPGTYDAFAIPDAKDGITIQAADENNKPIIKTMYDGSPTFTTFGTQGSGGIDLYAADVTLKNLKIEGYGVATNGWYCAPIGTYYEKTMDKNGLTIDGCEIAYVGPENGARPAAITLSGLTELTINNCVIDGFESGYYTEGGSADSVVDLVFTNNEVNVDDNALVFVAYDSLGEGVVTVTGNHFESGNVVVWDYGVTNKDVIALDVIALDNNTYEDGVELVAKDIADVNAMVTADKTPYVKAYTSIVKMLKYAPIGETVGVGYSKVEADMQLTEDNGVVLMGNGSLTGTVSISAAEELAINLNGKALTVGGDGLKFNNTAAVTLTNGTINGNITVDAATSVPVAIDGISLNGTITADTADVVINSGNFTADVTKYLAEGKKLAKSELQAYSYTVVDKKEGTVDATSSAGTSGINSDTVTDANLGSTGVTASDVATAVAENTSANTALEGAANTVEIEETTELTSAIETFASENSVTEAAVEVVKVPYLEVKDVEVSANTENTEGNDTLKYTVKAMVQTVITAEGEEDVPVGEPEILEVVEPIAMALPVPAAVVSDSKVIVKHTKDDGRVFYYEATVDDSNVATFTNPNGFSTFEILAPDDVHVVAKVGDSGFATLQEAVDYIDNNGTITVVGGTTHTVNLSASKTFTVENTSVAEITVTVNGTDYTIAETANEEIVYVQQSAGGAAPTNNIIVTFNTNGGSAIDTIRISANQAITEPKAPTKDGFTFAGWYTDEALTEVYDFSTRVTKSITLYAKWTENADNGESVGNTGSTGTEGSTGTVGGTASTPTSTYSDVAEADWFYDAVKTVTESGLMKGVTDKDFAPNGLLTRGMLVTILHRIAGEEAADTDISFNDVDGHWAADAVKWAAAESIVSGYDNGSFGVDDSITREQLAVMLYRYAGSPETAGDISAFTDAGDISEYAENAVEWAAENGIINGKGDGILDPKGNATRAEVAKMISVFVGLIK